MEIILFGLLMMALNNQAYSLPPPFVYVSDIDPSIQESIRYSSQENFTGNIVDGYKKPRAVLTLEAALALKNVQEELMPKGYSLLIYDAYRPQKAVNNFIVWSQNNDQKMKESYFPYVDKEKVFELGYVAKKSGHSRGSTVDLTLIKSDKIPKKITKVEQRKASDERLVPYLDDDSEDMFTSFDLFDEVSHQESSLIPEEHLIRRNYLKHVMRNHGFKEYENEWWHFTLINEPFKDTYFDFDIE
jgi:D-alanyl-D-alanine dipeptidase